MVMHDVLIGSKSLLWCAKWFSSGWTDMKTGVIIGYNCGRQPIKTETSSKQHMSLILSVYCHKSKSNREKWPTLK